MNSIKIGNEQRPLAEVDAQWITQQINGRRKDGMVVCVVVEITAGDIDVRFATPTCGGRGGGSRHLTALEHQALDLWQQHHLNNEKFSPGDVVAFVRQVLRLI